MRLSGVLPNGADRILHDRCPICGSVFVEHECHGWDDL
jgi:hypothetical protein